MEKLILPGFPFGAWERAGLDARQPQESLTIAQNVYLDDVGVLRQRGRLGQRNAGTLGAGVGTQTPVFCWAGGLLPGFREFFVVHSSTGPDFKATVLDAAGTAYARSQSYGPVSATPAIIAAAVIGNAVIMTPAGSAADQAWYAGSVMASGLVTCTVTLGSTNVTTAGNFITAGVDVGALMDSWFPTGNGYAIVTKVNSATSITVDRPGLWTDTRSRLFSAFGPARLGPFGSAVNGQVEGIAGRAVLMQNNVLTFSDGPDPTTGAHRTYSWPARNRHEFPTDAIGAALKALRDRLFVFTQAGNFAISGMAQEITDGSANPQHTIEQLTGKSVAMGQSGIVSWQGALIVPCRDGVFAMDGYGAPVLLSRGLPWAEMVRGGLTVGWATIFQGRYLLPVTYQGSTWTYVFRMDGLDTPNGTVFPASRLTPPANPVAFATSSSDKMLALGTPASGALEGGELFSTTSTARDYDNTDVIDGYTIRTTRIQLGTKGLIRRVRVRYAVSSDVSLNASLLCDVLGDQNGGSSGSARLEPDGYTHWVAMDLTPALEASAAWVTLSLLHSGAAVKDFVVHAIEVQYRAFGAP